MELKPLLAPDRDSYVADRMEESSRRADAGQMPLRRVRAPFVPPFVAKTGASDKYRWDGASSWDVRLARGLDLTLIRTGEHGLEVALAGGPNGSTITPIVDPDLVTWLCTRWTASLLGLMEGNGTSLFVFDQMSTARRLWTVADRLGTRDGTTEEAAEDLHHKAAHQIQLSTSLPTSSWAIVLDRAMNRLFWRPEAAGTGTFPEWASLLSGHSPFEGMRDCTLLTLQGQAQKNQVRFLTAMVRTEDAMLSRTSAFRSAGSATYHYKQSSKFSTAYEAYVFSDPDAMMAACTTGVAPMVRPVGIQKGEVVAQLSTPCRLKPGMMRLHTMDGLELGKAQMTGLRFNERLGLVGVFAVATTSYGKKVENQGYQWLMSEASRDAGVMAFMAEEPYLASSGGSTWTWTRKDFQGTPIRRDVPLDVSVAGAGS